MFGRAATLNVSYSPWPKVNMSRAENKSDE